MNAGDSARPLRPMLNILRQFSLLRGPFCCAVILGVSLLMVSGCGRYKEELETAKQQIERLNSDVKKLTEEVTVLNREKNRLSEEAKALSDKNSRMQRELDELSKARASLSAENKEIKQKNSAAEQEIASLKKEKADSAKEIEELKRRVADMTPQPTSPTAMPTETAKKLEELSPCDAVIAFMKASENIIRQQKGKERTKSLEQVKKQYEPRMKGAPEKAIKAAENWVKEGTKFWDQSSDDSTFRLLQLRNSVLEACGKSPDAAGFR